jgi:hypothetical protein
MLTQLEKRVALFLTLVLLAALLPLSALADPYPGGVSVAPYDENTIRVSWEPNAHADNYRVYRNNILIAETSPNTTEYYDTGISAGTAYWYSVATVEDGTEYRTEPIPAAWTVPLTAPVLTITDTAKDYYDAVFRAYLAWSEVPCASGYQIYVSVNGGTWEELFSSSVLSGNGDSPLAHGLTLYSYKVRAYNEFWYVVSDEHHKTEGPFSEPVDVTCAYLELGPWLELVKPWKIPPWPDPWQQEWILSLLSVYGDAVKWPAGAGVEDLAELAKCLLEGSAPSETGEKIMEGLHPHGLALLLGAYESPPDRAEAGVLAERLQEVSLILSGQLPETLSGKNLDGYLDKMRTIYKLVDLSGEADGDSSTLRVTRSLDGRIILSGPIREGTYAPDATHTLAPIIRFRTLP